MGDRIDELVRRIRLASTTAEYAADLEAALTDLAAIAREAEARARRAEAERDALLAEHEAVAHLNHYLAHTPGWEPQERLRAAYDNAERVIRG